jgi:xylulokinase
MAAAGQQIYLGFDLGTHAMKACALKLSQDKVLVQTHSIHVVFELDLPAFNPPVRLDSSTGSATSDPRLFLAALDVAFMRLRNAGCRMEDVVAVSGSAQMHGSVYVREKFEISLASLNAKYPLASIECFDDDCFAFPDAPVWLDSSTTKQCVEIEETLGGAKNVAEKSGSRAYERFTGPQVLKRKSVAGSEFGKTRRILLLSSFLASVICGKLVPEDVGDASGTNFYLLEAKPLAWWEDGLKACGAEGLVCDAPVEGWSVLGPVAAYFTIRYNLPPSAVCSAWSGDNPNCIASFGGLDDGDVLISLGTSDTAQWKSVSGEGAPFGHTFRSPLSCSERPEYFRMLCYANGSRTREAVRDGAFAVAPGSQDGLQGMSWEEFDEAVAGVEPGCGTRRRVATCYFLPEIVPRKDSASHVEVYDVASVLSGDSCEPIQGPLSRAETCRLLCEARALSVAVHAAALDGGSFHPKRILFAGGGSSSKALQQTFADVLNVPVYASAGSSSAAVGAARRAHHSVFIREEGQYIPFSKCTDLENAPLTGSSLQILASPRIDAVSIYASMKKAYAVVSNPA